MKNEKESILSKILTVAFFMFYDWSCRWGYLGISNNTNVATGIGRHGSRHNPSCFCVYSPDNKSALSVLERKGW